ncbi:MAG: DUF1616 domain-containing protein [Methanomassiliicoccales archaeon]|nr:DUF1616 domain-containing protein [Methanomassiliicoccales archaeon]
MAYLVDNNGILSEFAAVLFIIVPGTAILRLTGRENKLDIWERSILTVLISAVLSFIVIPSGQLILQMDWVTSTVLLLAPLSCVLLLVDYFFKAKVIDNHEGQERNSGILHEFKVISKRERFIVLMAMAVMAIILTASFAMLLNQDEEGFTEFYVLNENGNAYDYPTSVGLGNNTSIIVGIANREGQAVNYTVEIWLVNYTYIDQAVNVTQMYFVDSFSVVLESQEYNVNDPWSAQFEKEIIISPGVSGQYQLFLMLFKNGAEPIPGPSPPNTTTDYSKTEASWRIVMCVNNEINYLNLNLSVPP